MKKKILASNGNAYVQQNLEVLPDASTATVGQVATVTAGGNVAFVDPYLKNGGTISGALIANSFKLPNSTLTNLFENAVNDPYLNVRVIQSKSNLNSDGLYVGFDNTAAANTRIYDGSTTKYVSLVGGALSTVGFTKFLFGNQADDGTFAQFSGDVKFKGNSSVIGTSNFTGIITQGTTGGYRFLIDGGNGFGPQLNLVDGASNSFFKIGAYNSVNNFDNYANRDFVFSTGNTTTTAKLRLFSNGNLLLQNGGTFTDGGELFQVNGTSRFVGNMAVNANLVAGSVSGNYIATSGQNTGFGGSLTNPALLYLPNHANSRTPTAGTYAGWYQAIIGIPTLTSGNAGTIYTNASSFYIAGSPIASTNTAITNPYSLYVASGNTYFGGNIRIGTNDNTTYQVDLYNSSSSAVSVRNDFTQGLFFASSSGYSGFGTQNATDLVLRTNGTERMRILSGGNGVFGGVLTASSFKLPNSGQANLYENGTDDNYLNVRVIRNLSGVNADGLYIGYGNNGSGNTRFYDGGVSNYLSLNGATFSSNGFTKFLFGNQTDNGTFAQFSGAVHAKSTLKVDGTFSFGDSGTRTERTTDAGVAAYSKSGFYDALDAANFPSGSWWHLINSQHYNSQVGNNYAMQIAGSFFDQRIYFRKTNTNANQAWREFVTSDLAGNAALNGSIEVNGYINTNNVLYLTGSAFAFWDGAYQRMYKRIGSPFLSVSNTVSYYDNTQHQFRTEASVQVAQIDANGISTAYRLSGAKLILGSTVDNGSILQVTGESLLNGNARISDNLILNTNNRFLYCTDTGGSNRRYLGLSGGSFSVGDIDNSIPNSTNSFYAQNAHLFMNNGIETARIIQNGNTGFGTPNPNYKVEINGSLGVSGAVSTPIRVITGSAGTYAISATDHVVIIQVSGASTFTVDAPTAANKNRELIIVNKSGANHTLSRSYVDSVSGTGNMIYNANTLRLKYDGTNIQQL